MNNDDVRKKSQEMLDWCADNKVPMFSVHQCNHEGSIAFDVSKCGLFDMPCAIQSLFVVAEFVMNNPDDEIAETIHALGHVLRVRSGLSSEEVPQDATIN